MKRFAVLSWGLLLIAAAGCQGTGGGRASTVEPPLIRMKSGLQYQDLVVGKGLSPQPGRVVVVHYTGWLPGGQKFDSSYDRNKPFEFHLGRGEVIRGWDQGVATMKVGGKRKLVIPPNLGYGNRGVGSKIPPGSVLIFEVELLDVK